MAGNRKWGIGYGIPEIYNHCVTRKYDCSFHNQSDWPQAHEIDCRARLLHLFKLPNGNKMNELWELNIRLPAGINVCYTDFTESQEHIKGGLPSILRRGLTLQTKERRGCQWLHTRNFFFFVHSLLPLSVCSIRFLRTENSRPLLPIVNGWCCKAFSFFIFKGRPCVSGFPFFIFNIAHLAAGRKKFSTATLFLFIRMLLKTHNKLIA